MPFRKSLMLLPIAVLTCAAPPSSAQAYPIDCAILLCLAGGFPPSLPCAAARIEMIRRITPWPIEPPLQLWRCPMHASFARESSPPASAELIVGYALPHTRWPKPDREAYILSGYDSSIEAYLAAIKVYDFTYSRFRNRQGNCAVSANLSVGSYDPSGNFGWRASDPGAAPAWMFNSNDPYCAEAWFRGVGLEWRDYQGAQGTEVVRY